MKAKITGTRLKESIDYISVLWIILSTGSMYFCIFNMKLSMMVLLGIACCYLLAHPRIKKSQFITAATIFFLVILNGVINYRYFEINDDIAILLIRLVSIAIIFSNINLQTFKRNYCHIVFALCVLSLICFIISEFGITLPGEKAFWFKDNKYYIVTFYHTIGRWTKFHRNAGVFWESPAFAIIINTAIAFLMIGGDVQGIKRRNLFFAIYSITLLSTLATTAYIAYILLFISIILDRRGRKKAEEQLEYNKTTKLSWRNVGLILLMVAAVFAFYYVEDSMHIIERKLIMHGGSFSTRANDTTSDFLVALSRPLVGYGMFNNYTHEALLGYGVTDNSNWFASLFMYFGFPMAIGYILYFAFRLRKWFDCSFWSYILLLGAFVLFMNTENMGVMTLFLAYLIPISNNKENR